MNKKPKVTKAKHHAIHAHARHKKHYKSFRVRHVTVLLIASVLVVASAFQLGVYYQKSRPTTASGSSDTASFEDENTMVVRSSYGFAFAYNSGTFKVDATTVDQHTGAAVNLSGEQLSTEEDFQSVRVRLQDKSQAGASAAAQLNIGVQEKSAQLAKAQEVEGLSPLLAANTITPLVSDEDFTTTLLDEQGVALAGKKFIRRTYEHVPKFGSDNSKVYSVQWVGVLESGVITLHLQGLVSTSQVPEDFRGLLESLQFGENAQSEVLGLSTELNAQEFVGERYAIDRVSPAVVKIYHITCGQLIVNKVPLIEDSCGLSTGSGFFISSNGYIATNGHVVTQTAEDAFVNVLLADPAALKVFLQGAGLSTDQIANIQQTPNILAAVIARIYDLPEQAIAFQNEKHSYFVSLGEAPLDFSGIQQLTDLRGVKQTNDVIEAKLVASDYSAQDLYRVEAEDEQGFTASDVALLHASQLTDTPFMRLFGGVAAQNLHVSLIGFPGDAENKLVDSSTLSTTVTNGAISAIRDVAGGDYRIYQSDADASGGSSGGPAVDSNGSVLGIVTYRYKSSEEADAAKSYIRPVSDLERLVARNNVSLRQDGIVQTNWDTGLELYSQNRFSDALKRFNVVYEKYPSHRLVREYIASSKQAIAEGRNVSDSPLWLGLTAGLALAGAVVGMVLVIRHHAHHKLYLQLQSQEAKSTEES